MDVDQTPEDVSAESLFPAIVNYDALLKEPAERNDIEKSKESKLERLTATHTTPHASRFLLASKEQSHQYFNVYQNRLRQLRTVVKERVNREQQRLGTHLPVEERILDIKPGHQCYLIGTIYKDMPLKPNVLREYSKEQAILLVPEHQNFVSDQDMLILEDEGGRIKLVVSELKLVKESVTGTVVSVLGTQVDGGAFKVEQILRPGFPAQISLSSRISNPSTAKYVALVSGMNIGTPTFNPLFSSLLSDYLCGHLGSADEQESVARRVVRTILVGNIFCSDEEVPAHSKLRDHTKSFTALDQARLETVLKEVDTFLLELASNMQVDLLPGPKDPSNFSMPQQPLNKCLLPRAAQLSSLTLSTNPYSAIIDGIEFLGHSGQPTSNMQNYLSLKTDENVLDILESTLQWRHMAPTAPDTLSIFPFKVHDPFVIDSCPHVYFVGDQDEFDSKRVYGENDQVVQLVAVPNFSKTKQFVLLNLGTLDCHPVTISTWDD